MLREGDTLARLGGDEFVVVLVNLQHASDCIDILNRLQHAVTQPVPVGYELLHVTASMGVTFYPQAQDSDGEQLLRQADQAMYVSKQIGKNRFTVFDVEKDRALREHHEKLQHLRRALLGDELVLHYQPKVNMRNGAIVGVEALIRWAHPQLGWLQPAQFLPAIQNHALSTEVGQWVIEQAMLQLEQWQMQGLTIPISVNIGAHQLQQPNFMPNLHAMLTRHPRVRPHLRRAHVFLHRGRAAADRRGRLAGADGHRPGRRGRIPGRTPRSSPAGGSEARSGCPACRFRGQTRWWRQ